MTTKFRGWDVETVTVLVVVSYLYRSGEHGSRLLQADDIWRAGEVV